MTGTISNTIISTYMLQSQYTVLLSSGGVSVTSGNAIVGPFIGSTFGWTVANSGTVLASSAVGIGVDLRGVGDNVTNNAGGVIDGRSKAIFIAYRGGTVVNHGTIGSAADHWAINLNDLGTVTNAGSDSEIIASDRALYMNNGGVVNNGAGATIVGGNIGIWGRQDPLTLTNAGTIDAGSAAGINLVSGAVVTNLATGVIVSGEGIGADFTGTNPLYYGGATLTNYGTIAGATGQDAVRFRADYTNLLIDQPKAVFVGTVDGANTIGGAYISTLELASGASAGTLGGLGSQYVGFAQITIDSKASWALTGSNSLASGATLTNSGFLSLKTASLVDSGALMNDGVILLGSSTLTAASLTGTGSLTIGADGMFDALGTVAAGEAIAFGGSNAILQLTAPSVFAGTIYGFSQTRTIELTGVAHNPDDSAVIVGGSTLHVATSDGTFDLQMDKSQNFVGDTFSLTPSGGGTDINIACFAAGTCICTEHGAVAVETLRVGDRVRTLSEQPLWPVVWIGHRSVNCAHHPRPWQVWPVRVVAAAFGPGQPYRDLWLSPDHAVYVDGVLIPIRHLVNGTSIVQMPVAEVSYYHIELPQHSVLLAEGLPVESFLNTGDRTNFADGSGPIALHADFSSRVWEAEGCAPLIITGSQLDAARQRVNSLAAIKATAALRIDARAMRGAQQLLYPAIREANIRCFAGSHGGC